MKKIKSLLTPKLIILVLTLSIFAAGATFAIARNAKQKEEKESAKMIWQNDFHRSFSGADVFAEMEAMEKQMNKTFEEHRKLMAKMFHETRKQDDDQSGSKNSLALYQDNQSYRYELTFTSFKKEDVVISVNGGIMVVSAKSEKSEKDKKKGESHLSNNFFYSLSIPSDAVDNPDIKREEGKITIEFTKSKPKNSSETKAKEEGKSKDKVQN